MKSVKRWRSPRGIARNAARGQDRPPLGRHAHPRRPHLRGAAMRFRDRRDAGEQLARQLAMLDLGPVTVLAIPRGGVIVADAIVRTFGWPLDVMLPRKLRAPRNPELAFGAVTEDGTVFLDARLARTLHVTDDYLREE